MNFPAVFFTLKEIEERIGIEHDDAVKRGVEAVLGEDEKLVQPQSKETDNK
jgi:hypothetical protein